jgi:hypothetical protein
MKYNTTVMQAFCVRVDDTIEYDVTSTDESSSQSKAEIGSKPSLCSKVRFGSVSCYLQLSYPCVIIDSSCQRSREVELSACRCTV